MSRLETLIRFAHRPDVICAAVFLLSVNYLQLFGFVALGNDTGMWDVRYRTLTSALIRAGDLPLWLPNGGNGFPNLSLYYVMMVANPVGAMLGVLRPYDHLSLGIETALWRAVGFAGAYGFARPFVREPIGAAVVASVYVGSGVMAWASLSYNVLIGLMLAPWILASGTWLVSALSTDAWLRAVGVMALTYGAMIWCGYPAAWIMTPVLTGPILLILAARTPGAVRRLIAGVILAAAITLALIALLVSETLSLPIFPISANFRQETANMSDGVLRFVDLFGLVFSLPSALPGLSPPLVQPIYFGVISIYISIIFIVLKMFQIVNRIAIILLFSLGILASNTLNTTIADHPLFGVWTPPQSMLDFFVPSAYLLIIALILNILYCRPRNNQTSISFIFILYSFGIIFVSSDWSLANLLRYHVPPFSLVRYNFLFIWIVILLVSLSAWNILERYVLDGRGAAAIRPTTSQIRAISAIALSILALICVAALPTPDARGAGFPISGRLSVGVPQLAWQFLLVGIAVTVTLLKIFEYKILYISKRKFTFMIGICGVYLCILHFAFRQWNIDSNPTVSIHPLWILCAGVTFSLLFMLLFILAPFLTTRVFTSNIIASIFVFDILLAAPSYFSDNETLGAARTGWPYAPQFPMDITRLFKPVSGTTGEFRSDFPSLFDSTISPLPVVTRLQNAWGAAAERWIHFPSRWASLETGYDRWVTHDSLNTGFPTVDPAPKERRDVLQHTQTKASREPFEEPAPANASPEVACGGNRSLRPPAGRVSLLLATRVVVNYQSDCQRLLVFTDSWAPGWRADVDGEPVPVLRIDGAYRGAMVPAGEHILTWSYQPRHLWAFLVLLGSGAFVGITLVLAPWWSARVPSLRALDPWVTGTRSGRRVAGVLAHDNSLSITESPVASSFRWNSGPVTRDTVFIAGGVVLCVAICMAGFDASIDGRRATFTFALIRTAIVAAAISVLVLITVPRRPELAILSAVVILSPMPILQAGRHLASIGTVDPTVMVIDTAREPIPVSWLAFGTAPMPEAGVGVRLRAQSSIPAISLALSDVRPRGTVWWTRPLGGLRVGEVDITWRAAIERTAPYLTVINIDRLSIQAVSGGILVTSPQGRDVQATFVAMSGEHLARSGVWRLTSDGTGGSLTVDGSVIWRGLTGALTSNAIIGDASRDTEHGGSIVLERIEIRQRAVNQRERLLWD